jgi:soluble lytic murein transglycosylase-like protein
MKVVAFALLAGGVIAALTLSIPSGFLSSIVQNAEAHFGLIHGEDARVSPSVDSRLETSPCRISKAETVDLIEAAAGKYDVPAVLVTSIVAAESNFDCAAVSSKGAIGLMQLMPETAGQYGLNPVVPAENIAAGTQYLHWLMDRYRNQRNGIRHVIAAYNAGPGMVTRYRGVPPFRETRAYVTRVLGYIKQFSGRRFRSMEAMLHESRLHEARSQTRAALEPAVPNFAPTPIGSFLAAGE